MSMLPPADCETINRIGCEGQFAGCAYPAGLIAIVATKTAASSCRLAWRGVEDCSKRMWNS
jgi:hypothetical protein